MAFKGRKKGLESADGTSFPITFYDFQLKYLEIIFLHSRVWKGKTKLFFLDYEKTVQVRA